MAHQIPLPPLTEATLLEGVQTLAQRDADLGRIFAEYGPPPLWSRPEGFPTLVYIILEQQVSLASARAAFEKLLAALSRDGDYTGVTPQRFLELDDADLKRIGFSRQKTAYARILAGAVLRGELDLEDLSRMDDASARSALLRIKGIGPWTADIYLLMAQRRPDIWPSGDLAIAVAAQQVKSLPQRPTSAELEELSQAWRPWRAVAARLLWHHYLSRPRPNAISPAKGK